ncbi:hypothetical protein [Mycolicibacterium holsaticum]|uniref:hypothetical protein n=1 Tax=Mycolicibacterium holsaticum TaxID=152142 RepID=UPI001C7DAC36|nr:hypothetical protein [Mycolicibacterium holsaticum]MDA4110260.1 hypothetical protein [Mycolicibacterium holsaticum DSM 44478 = JCM 12374]QZA11844.1 hypothetical protein K3U96_22170 [Mycolicibacterium holsaticum DSM 44478 = JCM 12374]UNC10668.1 hypothetical protein H5U41_04650 [Mycolicibacterium holsaticum DSM 44478 = JCM 12374]
MDSGDLESRVSALEEQVQDLTGRVRATEQDATAARVLAGAADRDVTEFREEIRDFGRSTAASFNAHGRDFVDLRTHVDNGFVEIRGKFDLMAVGQQQIVDLLQSIITDEGRGGSAR